MKIKRYVIIEKTNTGKISLVDDGRGKEVIFDNKGYAKDWYKIIDDARGCHCKGKCEELIHSKFEIVELKGETKRLR